MADLPADHPIYNVVFKPSPRPPLKAVSNGSRILMLHSPADLALRWQQRQDRAWEGKKAPAPGDSKGADAELRAKQLAPFQFAVNLFIYAAGKRDLRNRLDSPWVGPTDSSPVQTVKVARLQYAGNWDPEPGAWRRFTNALQRETSYRADVLPIPLRDLKPNDAPLAHLTGTHRASFSAAEAAALKAYVEAGGVVLIDNCGGPGAFEPEVRSLLSRRSPTRRSTRSPRTTRSCTPATPACSTSPSPACGPTRSNDSAAASARSTCSRRARATSSTPTSTSPPASSAPEPGASSATSRAYCQALVSNALLWTLDGQADKR